MELHRLLRQKRFVEACCGRRWGKTHALSIHMLIEALQRQNWKAWWVDPSFSQAERVYFELKKRVPREIAHSVNDQRREIQLKNGSVLRFESAEKKDRLLGEGLDRMMINEASLVPEEVWTQILLPMLIDRGGRMGAAFTPRGQGHWTYRMFLQGNPGSETYQPNYAGVQFPSHSNPFLPESDLEMLKRTMPEDLYRQEILAEFLPDSAGVFRGIDKCILGAFDSWKDLPLNGPYIGGLDLARVEDFTVITILDKNGHVAWRERFNTIEWNQQRGRVIEVAQRYQAHLIIDRGSVGDVIVEDLRRAGISCEPYVFTVQSKADLVQELQVAIERQEISWPSEYQELTQELRVFQYEITAARNIRYNAPPGFHDDCVMSLALAVHGKRHAQGKIASYLGGLNVADLVPKAIND